MPGLGTIVNAAAIVAGGVLGLIFKNILKPRFQETVMKATGFAIMVMALGSVMARMLTVETPAGGGSGIVDTQGTVMMIVSLALGALLGELIDLERRLERFGDWLKKKTGNQGDTSFTNAFITASLTVCIGAMAVVGSIQDGISGDHVMLYAKALLDLIIIMMMTASFGKGCIFSAIPVVILQGSVTLLASLLAGVMTDQMIANISLVGGVLIFCVGVNIIRPKTIRVANLLPAVLIAIPFAFFGAG